MDITLYNRVKQIVLCLYYEVGNRPQAYISDCDV